MTVSTAVLPDITRPDVRAISVTRWIVGDLARQHAAVDAAMAEFERLGLPKGLLSLTCFVNAEGPSVLNYAQWASDEAHEEFLRTLGPTLDRGVDEAIPGIERQGPITYRLYRSYVPEGPTVDPGLMILVTIEFDGPGRARDWIDVVIDAVRAVEPVHGLITNHFHISVDDTRVINYTEWTDEQAHYEAIDSDTGPIGQKGSVGQRVRTMPGVTKIGFEHLLLYRSLNPPSPSSI